MTLPLSLSLKRLVSIRFWRNPTERQNEKTRQKAGFSGVPEILKAFSGTLATIIAIGEHLHPSPANPMRWITGKACVQKAASASSCPGTTTSSPTAASPSRFSAMRSKPSRFKPRTAPGVAADPTGDCQADYEFTEHRIR
eukprot:gene13468-16407_t